MIKTTRVNNTIVCFIDGQIHQKTVSDDAEALELFERVSNVNENSEEEILAVKEIFAPKLTAKEKEIKAEIAEAERTKSVLEWMQEIERNGDEHFEVKGAKLFMKDINITIPEFLALEFFDRRESQEDLSSFINFWRLCALNPDARVREDLYKFLKGNDMTVTQFGCFIGYRNANIKEEGNKELNEFVAKQWAKTKKWKKSPKKRWVVGQEGNYKIVKSEPDVCIGNLDEMYNKLSEAEGRTVYTDAHSGTTTIIIGEPVTIDRSECDADPNQTCSRGLHIGKSTWLKENYYGNVGLAVLVNPMNVVAVPYDGGIKLRCSEYLPISLIDYDEDGNVIPFDSTTFEYEYAEHTVEELEKLCTESRFESLKEHEIIQKEIDKDSLKYIYNETTTSLDEMNQAIQNKVVKV